MLQKKFIDRRNFIVQSTSVMSACLFSSYGFANVSAAKYKMGLQLFYDDAIRFYTEKLDFTLMEDTAQSETKRWVLLAPKGSEECCLLLAKGVGEEQRSRIGNQTGGRVFLFLRTDDFWIV